MKKRTKKRKAPAARRKHAPKKRAPRRGLAALKRPRKHTAAKKRRALSIAWEKIATVRKGKHGYFRVALVRPGRPPLTAFAHVGDFDSHAHAQRIARTFAKSGYRVAIAYIAGHAKPLVLVDIWNPDGAARTAEDYQRSRAEANAGAWSVDDDDPHAPAALDDRKRRHLKHGSTVAEKNGVKVVWDEMRRRFYVFIGTILAGTYETEREAVQEMERIA